MKTKELSYLFESRDAFQIYTEEVRDAELFRDSYRLFEEIIRNNPELINEGIWDTIKAGAKAVGAGAKAAVGAATTTFKAEKLKSKLNEIGKNYLLLTSDPKTKAISFKRDPAGNVMFETGKDARGFWEEIKSTFNDVDPSILKDAVNKFLGPNSKNEIDSEEKRNSDKKQSEGENIDINKSDAEVQINNNIKSLKTINSNDFINAFKEAKNNPDLMKTIDDSDFVAGIKKALNEYLKIKEENSQGNDKELYKVMNQKLQNQKLSKPIRYAAAAMMHHMIEKLNKQEVQKQGRLEADRNRIMGSGGSD